MSMITVTRNFLVSPLLLLAFAGCASTQQWASAGGDRQEGVVRVSYEYPEHEQPELDDTQATTLALQRCNAWGYSRAEPIAGQLRQCTNVDDGNCNVWTVTREYQCSGGDISYASRLSR